MTAAWVRPAVIDVLEPGYAELFERVAKGAARDERVRAMWLSGSLARGTADRASDLDVLLAVGDDAHDAFAAGWREWLASITPTVIARPLPFLPGSFYSVTPHRMRLDVVVERVSQLPSTFFRERTLVFDRDELHATIPPPLPATPPNKDRVAEIVEEFFRDHGMFNVVVDREDWLLANEAVHVMRTLLYRLYVEANAPRPASGVKRWSDKLTAEQRAVLEALPTGAAASRDDVVRTVETVACAFVREARPICARLGVPWPAELERATVEYLRAHGLPGLEGAE
jgi:predicted nucleotidyltransferase